MFALNPVMATQMEHFWKVQDALVGAAEAYSRDWFQRRHEAAETALEVVHKVNGNGGDGAGVLRALLDWQSRSMQRLQADAQQWVGFCSNCTRSLMNETMQAGQEPLDGADKHAKAGMSAKHSTPV